MVYENAGGYTTMLQEAFADYKNLAKYIQTLSLDFDAGKTILKESQMTGARDRTAFYGKLIEAAKAPSAEPKTPTSEAGSPPSEPTKQAGDTSGGVKQSETDPSDDEKPRNNQQAPVDADTQSVSERQVDSEPTEAGGETPGQSTSLALRGVSTTTAKGRLPEPRTPLYIVKPYEATLLGLEKARRDIRLMMNRIVSEVFRAFMHALKRGCKLLIVYNYRSTS